MQSTYQSLAKTIRHRAAECPRQRYLVAIAGAPGSGKTTIAHEVAKRINNNDAAPSDGPHKHNLSSDKPVSQSSSPSPTVCISISMDGFHLPRSTLHTLPNKEAYRRRGAPWTFDADKAVEFVWCLRKWANNHEDGGNNTTEPIIYAPTFSHALKDPVPDALPIPSSGAMRIILLLEGNYLLLDEPPWDEIGQLVDLRVFVEADPALTRERVAQRHLQAGIESTIEDAYRRVDGNDLINGRLVNEKKVAGIDLVVTSLQEEIGG
ncbi:hypothetical protein VTN96DRAFT_7908 [Rasamsonia emersonii]